MRLGAVGRKMPPRSEETRKKISVATRIYSDESRYSAKSQRRHFNQWLKGNRNGFEKYIGISLTQFRTWIEKNFLKGMNWKNHGQYGWHYGHRFPLCTFDLTNEDKVKKAWYFGNIYPEWATDRDGHKGNWNLPNRHPAQDWFEY